MRKILFLDVDGVLNSKKTLQRSTHGMIGVDPYLSVLVDRIIQATGCEVVLSSSWRNMSDGYKEINEIIPLIDKTGRCCNGIRGVEIYEWLVKNIPWEDRSNETFRYAILDDDSDMLLWQKDHFFQTSFETGITEEIAAKVVEHLNRV